MNIYISGISGTGLGPLALMALDAGIHVTGSDRAEGAITGELRRNGIDFYIGDQDGTYLRNGQNREYVRYMHAVKNIIQNSAVFAKSFLVKSYHR